MSGSSASSLSGSTATAPSYPPRTPVSSCAKRSAANPTCSRGGTRISTPARWVVRDHTDCVVDIHTHATVWTLVPCPTKHLEHDCPHLLQSTARHVLLACTFVLVQPAMASAGLRWPPAARGQDSRQRATRVQTAGGVGRCGVLRREQAVGQGDQLRGDVSHEAPP